MFGVMAGVDTMGNGATDTTTVNVCGTYWASTAFNEASFIAQGRSQTLGGMTDGLHLRGALVLRAHLEVQGYIRTIEGPASK